MKNKVMILIASVLIAIIVIVVGIFLGNTELKESDGNKNTTAEDNSETESTSNPESDTNIETPEETQAPTEPPTTPEAPTEQNQHSDAIDPNKPMIALTFDDGPAGEKTARLLDALEQYGAHATFFVVGNKIAGDEEIIKRASSIGCEIGNHTYSHSKLTTLDDAAIANEINGVVDTIKELTGQKMVTCRPPYGAIDERVTAIINAPIILWSIDTRDWETRNVAQTIANIQQNVQDGDIILMHDIHAESVEAAIQIIPWLQQQGYQLVTVSELGYYKRGGLTKDVRYGSIR